ncbi:C-type mannose receptor 2-like [Saccoglossus kowalevskii]|uniref:Collectin-11-like n=1 Tax=Saccoglossus kowalevskii TaxID=10224 RepID=A0ABM0GTZ6_SACKO|nr:PREDICTED: collectin-11-like [Saccoglossus kowalevskii]
MGLSVFLGCLVCIIGMAHASNLLVVKEKKNMDDAVAYCESQGLILVKETDSFKHDDVVNAMTEAGIKNDDIWINGDIKSSKEVIASDGDILDDYLPWQSGQPDGSGDCLQLWAGVGNKWDDTPCSVTKYFVCDEKTSLRVLTNKKSFDDAQADCVRRGGNLAKDNSATRNRALLSAVANYPNEDFWFNGKVEDKVVSTTDGRIQYCYSNWQSGQPDNSGDSIQLWAAVDHKWDDTPGSNKKMYICEL